MDDDVVDRVMRMRGDLIALAGQEPNADPERRRRVAAARARLLADAGTPLTRFRGTLKQVPAAQLNDRARTVMDTLFPTFANTVEFDPERALAAASRDLGGKDDGFLGTLTEVLAEQKRRDERQERRYAGDRNLPRGRYFTVCDVGGDDSQTLCREMFAYVDSRVPGWVFVGDPWDAELYGLLGGDALPDAYRNCAYVILLEPLGEGERPAYQAAYEPVLRHLADPHGLKLLPIPVTWVDVEIPHVLDLRRPEAQDWLFRFFRAGDGAVLIEKAEPAVSFFDMLPALYHPYCGGSGITAGIGSWLRAMGVNALVYPSARSDTAIEVSASGDVVSSRSWNLVLYAGADATPDQQVHVDTNPWYTFEDAGCRDVTVRHGDRSWRLSGVEAGYRSTRELILAALTRSG